MNNLIQKITVNKSLTTIAFVNKTLIIILIASVFFSCKTWDKKQDIEKDSEIEAIIDKMSIEEKVGQMTQITLEAFAKPESLVSGKQFEFDTAKLREAIVDYHLGSILNTANNPKTKEQWYSIISQIQDYALNKTRLGIPVLYGIDAIHGANYTIGSTLFPQQINQGAARNTQLVEDIAAATAYETRASSIPWNFSPVLEVGRNPVWPRLWETFGEDTYLVQLLGKHMVKGYQGENPGESTKVAACAKHYVGYSVPLSGKDRTPAWIPEIFLREYFLPPFKSAIDQGILTVMVNSSEINGIPVHADYHILTEILRNELNFKGIAVTDWEDIIMLHKRHHIADTPKEAVRLAINAGIDMSMVPYDFSFYTYLVELVKEGAISEERINESVRRILYVKKQLGLFTTPINNPADYPDFASDKYKTLSKNAAIESITLLKNTNDILPLTKNTKVLVTGFTANSMRCLNGGWSYTWQGDKTDEFTKDKNTVLEAIQLKAGAQNVQYSEGCTFDSLLNVQDVLKKASQSEVIVLCLGENSYTEKPGDIDDLSLPDAQIELANQLAKTGKPVIVVLLEGRPRIIRKFADNMAGIVLAYLPGNEGGDAIADILFGDANPSGKLPYTYPRYTNALVTYDHKHGDHVIIEGNKQDFNPQFEFGFGLSYTTFQYDNLKIDKENFSDADSIVISVDVKNTGKKTGKEVVELYTSDLYASITPSVKRLRAFSKIELNPAETKTVKFTITASDLAFVNTTNEWITEKGEFVIRIGNLYKSIYYN